MPGNRHIAKVDSKHDIEIYTHIVTLQIAHFARHGLRAAKYHSPRRPNLALDSEYKNTLMSILIGLSGLSMTNISYMVGIYMKSVINSLFPSHSSNSALFDIHIIGFIARRSPFN